MNRPNDAWILPTKLSAGFFAGSGLSMLFAPHQVGKILRVQPLVGKQSQMYFQLAGIALAIVGRHQLTAANYRLVDFAK
jgi:uncharacterized membrane protein